MEKQQKKYKVQYFQKVIFFSHNKCALVLDFYLLHCHSPFTHQLHRFKYICYSVFRAYSCKIKYFRGIIFTELAYSLISTTIIFSPPSVFIIFIKPNYYNKLIFFDHTVRAKLVLMMCDYAICIEALVIEQCCRIATYSHLGTNLLPIGCLGISVIYSN